MRTITLLLFACNIGLSAHATPIVKTSCSKLLVGDIVDTIQPIASQTNSESQTIQMSSVDLNNLLINGLANMNATAENIEILKLRLALAEFIVLRKDDAYNPKVFDLFKRVISRDIFDPHSLSPDLSVDPFTNPETARYQQIFREVVSQSIEHGLLHRIILEQTYLQEAGDQITIGETVHVSQNKSSAVHTEFLFAEQFVRELAFFPDHKRLKQLKRSAKYIPPISWEEAVRILAIIPREDQVVAAKIVKAKLITSRSMYGINTPIDKEAGHFLRGDVVRSLSDQSQFLTTERRTSLFHKALEFMKRHLQ